MPLIIAIIVMVGFYLAVKLSTPVTADSANPVQDLLNRIKGTNTQGVPVNTNDDLVTSILKGIVDAGKVADAFGGNVSNDTLSPQPIIVPEFFSDASGGSGGGDTEEEPPDVQDLVPQSQGLLSEVLLSMNPQVALMPQGGNSGGGVDRWNDFIDRFAKVYGVNPVLVKAVIAVESSGNPEALNPVVKGGVTAKELRAEITTSANDGFDALQKYGVDPSMGLMQVRFSTAKGYFPNVTPIQMFDGEVNIELGTKHIKNLMHQGIPMPDGIDSYNMGAGNYRKGRRNFNYQQKVLNFMNKFSGDF